jgi:catechol 2,3-dioxygenase-like lactoylglutathione lyase family enzyme
MTTRAEVLAFMREHKMAVQASVSSSHAPQAAVVGFAVTDDFELFFDTVATTRKAVNLRRNSHVAFVIGGLEPGDERTVQYEGTVDEPRGDELARLQAIYFERFPDGPARQSWPGLIYLRARPTWVRFSDFNRQPPDILEFASAFAPGGASADKPVASAFAPGGATADKPVAPVAIHHIQLAMPPGEEGRARAFYAGVLGMTEIAKPSRLVARGGVWFVAGDVQLHLGVEAGFKGAKKAHPALLVPDLAGLKARCRAAGVETVTDEPLEGFDRFYAADPFGNRLEFLQPTADRR